jgi:clan AA aspartic protease (TIGR02281 family)
MTQQIRLKLPKWSNNNVILLNVRLNEQTLIRMILDTGAKYTIITPEVAQRVALDLEMARAIPVTTATQLQSAKLVELEQIDIHGFKIFQVETAIMHLPSALGAEGLLGLSFLRQCRMVLDCPQQLLEFAKE